MTSLGCNCSKEKLRKIKIQGPFMMLSVITNIYNKKTKGPILMELFTATQADACMATT